ncbi:hypothetical protein EBZ39_14435 [bacterium]|nr:hypothetical protein [bacterium]
MTSLLLNKLKIDIEKKLASGLVGPRVLLDRMRLIDEESRKSPQYHDPNYLPFYYHLSKFIKPRVILQVGFNLALPLCCFLRGSESASSAIGLQIDSREFYSPRLALANIKDVKGRSFASSFHLGKVTDSAFADMVSPGVDLVMITEKVGPDLIDILEVCWQSLNLDGFILLDKAPLGSPEGKLFSDFCRSKNRDFIFFSTRYGTALSMK